MDNHTCHCSVCKRVTGQDTTHVVFFKHGDLAVDNEAGLKRQPFNDQNPDGPLELCTCADCGTPSLLDDKQRRIRVIVPNLMGHDTDAPSTKASAPPSSGPTRRKRAEPLAKKAKRPTPKGRCGAFVSALQLWG